MADESEERELPSYGALYGAFAEATTAHGFGYQHVSTGKNTVESCLPLDKVC